MSSKNILVADGNEIAAKMAYAFTEVAAIYPITPSSPMSEHVDEWSARGLKNMFGQTVTLVEMQSEAGAIGAVHGTSECGTLATTFTSSQGLMLMIPTMHRIAGARQPVVIHIASRTVGTHSMSIFGDHSDVMAARQTGFAMLATSSVQEIADLAAIPHLAAIESRIPFMHFFDGFRTSHEIQKVEVPNIDDVVALYNKKAYQQFRDEALNPEHPTLRNTVQNPDVYFQFREANNTAYSELPDIVESYMEKINALTGRDYHLFNYYGSPDAEHVIVAIGSVSGPAIEVVEHLVAQGEKVGFLQVHLYRPFAIDYFLRALPETVKHIAVLDRCKEMGSAGEPLYLDVVSAFANRAERPEVYGGRYGLSSKDTDPAQIMAVFENLKAAEPKANFTIGITDDVTHLSLPTPDFVLNDPDTIACKFWGLGSDGTVGANKNSIKIIGEETNLNAQGYFEFDTKKAFGITRSHLRFGKNPINSSYFVKWADFIACHNQSFLDKYDILGEMKPGGTFLLNCEWGVEELEEKLPAEVKRVLANKGCKFYIIDANKRSRALGLGNRANMVLQAAFFKLAGIIPVEEAVGYMKDAVVKTYSRKGDDIVNMNIAAVDAGLDALVEVEIPESWTEATTGAAPAPLLTEGADVPKFVREAVGPASVLKGDDLPVSVFVDNCDGVMPMGTTAYEKRGFATDLPVWDSEACTQCNRCSFVCPHAVIRPYLLNDEEREAAPEGFQVVDAKGKAGAGYGYSLQVSALDCTSCGSCVAVCPAKADALVMKPTAETSYSSEHWEYALNLSDKGDVFKPATIKGSQFRQPLVEFSGACAGCGETPYAKLLTQLYGDRIYWANATGCSQAWAAAGLAVPYTTNKEGKGVAWANSLFENNAEFSLGMYLATQKQRDWLKGKVEALAAAGAAGATGSAGVAGTEGANFVNVEGAEGTAGTGAGTVSEALVGAANAWLDAFADIDESHPAGDALVAAIEAAMNTGELNEEAAQLCADILSRRDQLGKKTVWMFGGDGWAYDIGLGGLEHVFAENLDVNVFVIDTEMYSNTGGQASKATPLGSTAQFQFSGKKTSKFDLGKLMMSYGNCYVASVAMGADYNQLLKAITEAEAFPGPSIIIAYTPCAVQGIKIGINNVQEEMARAVASGYWMLYRYNPANKEQPFTLDSKEPTMRYEDFLRGEVRYASLDKIFPDEAERLFTQAAAEAKERYEYFKKLDGRE